MNGKRFADIMICSLSAAIVILIYIYMEESVLRQIVCCVGSVLFVLFLIMAVADTDKTGKKLKRIRADRWGRGSIHALALLDEDGREISEWNISGKISLLIGRDTKKEDVDINLMNTAFAGMVDRQHAVMNYTAGQWYIEDLDSANGIRIQKKDGRLYRVSRNQPCLVEKSDIIYIGLTKLAAK